MLSNNYDISLRLLEISDLLHDLSRDVELATQSMPSKIDAKPLRKIADLMHLEARNFRCIDTELT